MAKVSKSTRLPRLRRRLLDRDGRRCIRCDRPGMLLTIHHLNPRRDGGSNTLDKLCLLCEPCHNWVEVNLFDFPELLTRAGVIGSYPWANPGMPTTNQGQGYPMPGDKADIWALWVKQGRKGAVGLMKKYAAPYRPTRINGKPIKL